jgi:hypothetical protein
MSLADEALSELDAALAEAGETVRLLRMTGTGAQSRVQKEVTCRMTLRGYAPNEVVQGSGITQQDQRMILSPTQIIAANWPGDGRYVPRAGDRIISNRGVLTIQSAAGVYVDDRLVRIEGTARGA